MGPANSHYYTHYSPYWQPRITVKSLMRRFKPHDMMEIPDIARAWGHSRDFFVPATK